MGQNTRDIATTIDQIVHSWKDEPEWELLTKLTDLLVKEPQPNNRIAVELLKLKLEHKDKERSRINRVVYFALQAFEFCIINSPDFRKECNSSTLLDLLMQIAKLKNILGRVRNKPLADQTDEGVPHSKQHLKYHIKTKVLRIIQLLGRQDPTANYKQPEVFVTAYQTLLVEGVIFPSPTTSCENPVPLPLSPNELTKNAQLPHELRGPVYDMKENVHQLFNDLNTNTSLHHEVVKGRIEKLRKDREKVKKLINETSDEAALNELIFVNDQMEDLWTQIQSKQSGGSGHPSTSPSPPTSSTPAYYASEVKNNSNPASPRGMNSSPRGMNSTSNLNPAHGSPRGASGGFPSSQSYAGGFPSQSFVGGGSGGFPPSQSFVGGGSGGFPPSQSFVGGGSGGFPPSQSFGMNPNQSYQMNSNIYNGNQSTSRAGLTSVSGSLLPTATSDTSLRPLSSVSGGNITLAPPPAAMSSRKRDTSPSSPRTNTPHVLPPGMGSWPMINSNSTVQQPSQYSQSNLPQAPNQQGVVYPSQYTSAQSQSPFYGSPNNSQNLSQYTFQQSPQQQRQQQQQGFQTSYSVAQPQQHTIPAGFGSTGLPTGYGFSSSGFPPQTPQQGYQQPAQQQQGYQQSPQQQGYQQGTPQGYQSTPQQQQGYQQQGTPQGYQSTPQQQGYQQPAQQQQGYQQGAQQGYQSTPQQQVYQQPTQQQQGVQQQTSQQGYQQTPQQSYQSTQQQGVQQTPQQTYQSAPQQGGYQQASQAAAGSNYLHLQQQAAFQSLSNNNNNNNNNMNNNTSTAYYHQQQQGGHQIYPSTSTPVATGATPFDRPSLTITHQYGYN